MKLSEWLLKLNDQVSGGLGRVVSMSDKASKSFTGLQEDINQFGDAGSQAISAVADQIPGLSGALGMLSSPIGAAGVGIGLVTAGLYKSVEAAREFDSQFLELRQLNLSKPKAELDALNGKVLDLAYANGFNATATAKAYFDIQSATGKYGEEVDAIVEKTGLFARVTKADMDASIQGVAKSINAFKLGAKDMDMYFASSFKTVQVGITTFDQLAQVQTDYAGAAAAANQKVDDANKLFAAFTSSAKSVNEAATLTKTAFQDITKKATIDGFKRIGVNVFDASGKMRSIDAITRELVPRLGKLNDLQFANLKEEIGGSEGLRGYLDKVKGMGPGLVKMFDSFDNTKFDMSKAIQNANGDLNVMAQIWENRINVSAIRLGQEIMPTILEKTGAFMDDLDKGLTLWRELYNESDAVRGVVSNIGEALWEPFAAIGAISERFRKALDFANNFTTQVGKAWDIMKGTSFAQGIKRVFDYIGQQWSNIKEGFGAMFKYVTDPFKGIVKSMLGSVHELGTAIRNKIRESIPDSLKKILKLDWGNNKTGKSVAEAAATNGGTGLAENPADTKIDPTGTPDPNADLSKGLSDVSGGGKQVRNVTVNIAKLIESINIKTDVGQRISDTDLVRQIEEAVVRAITGAEMALSNG